MQNLGDLNLHALPSPRGAETSELSSTPTPTWAAIIHSFINALGYSYNRLAYRTNLSPSALQKLIKYPDRKPRDKAFYALCTYYYKIFYGPQRSEKAAKHVATTHDETLYKIIRELKERDFFEENKCAARTLNDQMKAALNFFRGCRVR